MIFRKYSFWRQVLLSGDSYNLNFWYYVVAFCCFLYFLVAIRQNAEIRKACMFVCRDSKEGGKLVSYSTASLGVRGTLRNRVGGGSSEEKKQAECVAPGRRRIRVHRGVGPGQRSGPALKEA